MSDKHLAIYLNDHLAGAVGALEMIAHVGDVHAHLVDAGVLGEIEKDIEEDHAVLEQLMERLSISRSHTRRAVGWLAERVARLKMAADDPTDGAFRAFESLEIISLGVEGKISLWTALTAAAGTNPILSGLDYPRLIERARTQRRKLERLHEQAARDALGDGRGD